MQDATLALSMGCRVAEQEVDEKSQLPHYFLHSNIASRMQTRQPNMCAFSCCTWINYCFYQGSLAATPGQQGLFYAASEMWANEAAAISFF